MNSAALLGLVLLALGTTPTAHAAAYTPTDDAKVVQRLPSGLQQGTRWSAGTQAGWGVDTRGGPRTGPAAGVAAGVANGPAVASMATAADAATAAKVTTAAQAAHSRAAAPQNLDAALRRARASIDRARRLGDPRELGYAQAALAPWWRLAPAQTPAPVRLLRASILQSQHAFAPALQDLDSLLRADSGVDVVLQAQAGLVRASILQVTGELSQARLACQALQTGSFKALGEALLLPAKACEAELRSLLGVPRGAAEDSAQRAGQGAAQQPRLATAQAAAAATAQPAGRAAAQQAARDLAALAGQDPDNRWLALVRAELAERLADAPMAERLYRQALGLAPGAGLKANTITITNAIANAGAITALSTAPRGTPQPQGPAPASAEIYAVAAFADWLLGQGRAADALALWGGAAQGFDDLADASLLRVAMALQRLGDARAANAAQNLQARFDAARLRGERLHEREEARFALDVLGQPQAALALAQSNWSKQREPADALLLHRAAQAAGQAQAAAPIDALRAAGWFDQRLLAEPSRAQTALKAGARS